ncbi:MAG: LytTR family transcriptional regulator DNA-binding domain-containing protein [Lachnospiraceae bacterium]|nr:LytTR family transcriptional regulator DNA-binding domain-containing protein [Lachnospiraceae bacterium]
MNVKPEINVEFDSSCKVPKITIQTNQKTELIENIIYAIERCVEDEVPKVTAYSGETMVLLNQRDISRIYTQNRKLVICTSDGTYESKLTLKDLEDVLDEDIFVRISRFEIVNLRKISAFDLSIAGTIKVFFEDKSETWVARRYVKTIQQKLSRMGKGGERHE